MLDRAEEVNTTSAKVTTADVKLLRGAQVNAAVITVLLLSEISHKRIVNIMACVPKAVEIWEGHVRKDAKSAVENREWLRQQFAGAYNTVLQDVLKTLLNQEALQACGFDAYLSEEGEEREVTLMEDLRMAHTMGNLAARIVSHRFRRSAYLLVGWPQRQLGLLEPSMHQVIADDFHHDYEVYVALSDLPRFAPLQKILDRSSFRYVPTMQYVHGYGASDWRVSPELREVSADRATLVTSLVNEESVAFAKNASQIKGSKRARRTEKVMAVCIGRQLLSKRFRYDEPDTDAALTRKRQRLSKEAFRSVEDKCTVPLTGIASADKTAPYYTSLPMDLCRQALDLTLLREVYTYGALDDLENTALNKMCDSRHPFVFRRLCVAGSAYQWQLGLFHVRDTCAASWPVDIRHAQGHPDFEYVDMLAAESQPLVIPVLDWHTVTARKVEWKPPSWVSTRLPGFVCPGVRLWCTSEEMPLLELLAQMAFLSWDLPELTSIAKMIGLNVNRCTSLSDMLFEMISLVLPALSEMDVLDIMQQRVAQLHPDDDFDVILEVEEAEELLNKEDRKHVQDEQNNARSRRAAYQSFAHEYSERRRAARNRKPRPAAGSGSGSATDATPVTERRQLPRNGMMTQGEGSRFMPPGGYLWQSRKKQAWLSHVRPMKPVAHSWNKHGPDRAQFLAIVTAWRQYCTLEGIPPEDCPMGGVYDDHDGAPGR